MGLFRTFTGLYRGLTAVIEDTHTSFLDNYSSSVQRIEAIPNLTQEMRADHISRAYSRALRGMNASESRFEELLDQVSAEVRRVIQEIGA